MSLLDLVIVLAFLIVLQLAKWPITILSLIVLVAVLGVARLIRGDRVFPKAGP